MDTSDVGPGASWLRRTAPAIGLFLLAPATAEYLSGYDSTTGDLGTLLGGLIIFAPLYGAPAVLIRESARRTGRGWPTILSLGLAFGVVQAGLVDHSLFNTSYRDIDYWQSIHRPTFLPGPGISAYLTLIFLSGHAIWSIGAPIAVVESFVPSRATTPWLRRPGLAVMGVLYVAASMLVLVDHVGTGKFLPSPPQLIGAAIVAGLLIVAGFTVGKGVERPVERPAPGPWPVGAAAFAALSLPSFMEGVLSLSGFDTSYSSGWTGVAIGAALLAVLAALAMRWSRREGWGQGHRLALAGGALLTNAWGAFLVDPIGDVSRRAKLGHNVGFLLATIVLLIVAARAIRRGRDGGPARS